MNKSSMPGTDYKDISTVRGEGQWQAMGRLLRGTVTCIHMWSLASGNLLSRRLTVCLRTQYPCGYNYNHHTKEDWGSFTTSLNKEELTASELPDKLLKCTHRVSLISFFFFLILKLHNNFIFIARVPGSSAWSEWLFLITPNTDVLS